MQTFLRGQIDQLYGFAYAANGGLEHRGRFAGNGDHGAIVIRVFRPIQQSHTFNAHRRHNGFDTPGVPAFREVQGTHSITAVSFIFVFQSAHVLATNSRNAAVLSPEGVSHLDLDARVHSGIAIAK